MSNLKTLITFNALKKQKYNHLVIETKSIVNYTCLALSEFLNAFMVVVLVLSQRYVVNPARYGSKQR